MRQATTGLVLGPVLLRLLAFLIDGAILLVINLALTSAGIVALEQGRPANAGSLVVLLAVGAIYHIGFLATRSVTPGKMALNIYVAYPDGSPIRPDSAILRYLVQLVENLFLVGTIVSLVLMITDRDRRTIHDRVAGTLVLAGKPGAPLRATPDDLQRPQV